MRTSRNGTILNILNIFYMCTHCIHNISHICLDILYIVIFEIPVIADKQRWNIWIIEYLSPVPQIDGPLNVWNVNLQCKTSKQNILTLRKGGLGNKVITRASNSISTRRADEYVSTSLKFCKNKDVNKTRNISAAGCLLIIDKRGPSALQLSTVKETRGG